MIPISSHFTQTVPGADAEIASATAGTEIASAPAGPLDEDDCSNGSESEPGPPT